MTMDRELGQLAQHRTRVTLSPCGCVCRTQRGDVERAAAGKIERFLRSLNRFVDLASMSECPRESDESVRKLRH